MIGIFYARGTGSFISLNLATFIHWGFYEIQGKLKLVFVSLQMRDFPCIWELQERQGYLPISLATLTPWNVCIVANGKECNFSTIFFSLIALQPITLLLTRSLRNILKFTYSFLNILAYCRFAKISMKFGDVLNRPS